MSQSSNSAILIVVFQNLLAEQFHAFKYKDFRYLFSGQFISTIGSQMQIVALGWHIYVLTHSALLLGILGLSRFVPVTVFALFGGTTADSFNRKKVMYTTQTLLTIFSGILAILTFTNHITVLEIYILTALSAAVLAFDNPARQSLVPNLVPREKLANAISLNNISFESASILGPAVAGFIIAAFGPGTVYLLNAVSFIAVIIGLFLMQHNGEIKGDAAEVNFEHIVEGIKFITSKTIVWSTMLLDFFSTFFSSATTLLPIYAKDILHVGPQGLGFLYAADSVGGVIAAFLILHIKNMSNVGKILLYAIGLYGLATILFGFSRVFWISFLALFLVGFGDTCSTIIRNTIRHLSTPDTLRGRMTSINMIFFMGGPQLGEFEGGLVAAAFGAPISVISGGIATVLVVGLVAYLIPTLRNYKEGSE